MFTRKAIVITIISSVWCAICFIATYFQPRPVLGSPDYDFDPVFHLPKPPTVPYVAKNHNISCAIMSLFFLSGVVMGFQDYRKTKSWLPLLLSLSGLFIALPEIFYDVIGCVYFPYDPVHDNLYGFLGRRMPRWILAGWSGFGSLMNFQWRVFKSNPTTKSLWIFLGLTSLSSVIFEEVLLAAGVYHYYGNQPLILFGLYPFWWLPCNSVGTFLAAALAYRYEAHLQGIKGVFTWVMTPMSVTAVYGASALPAWIAVNSTFSWFPTQVLGLCTFGLGIVCFGIVLDVVLGRPALDMDKRGGLPKDDEKSISEREPLLG